MKQIFVLNYYVRLIFLSSLFLFFFRFLFSNDFLAIIINTIADYLIFCVIYVIFEIILGISMHFKRKEIGILFAKIFFYVCFSISFILAFVNSIYLDYSTTFKYNLMNFDLGVVIYFIENIVEPFYFFVLVLVMFCLFFVAKFKPRKVFFSLTKKWFLYITIFLLIVFMVLLVPYMHLMSNFYINTLEEYVFRSTNQEVEFPVQNLDQIKYDLDIFNRNFDKNYSDYNLSSNQKVLVFVMEQVTWDDFVAQKDKIPDEESFFLKVKNNSHVYTNYYTSNQDSRTAIWTMFTGEFIPFESYLSDWNKYYGSILYEKNLVDFFRYHDYIVEYFVAMDNPTLIFDAYKWDRENSIEDFNEKNNDSYFCTQEFEFQRGCEDMILMDKLKSEVVKNENDSYFLIQEFIFGHGNDYMEKLNKSRVRYYNDYLLELYNYMQVNDLLDNTTIVVVSDHGDKGYMQKSIDSYKIPMVVVNNNLEYKEIDDLKSHVDFKDILLSYFGGFNYTSQSEGRFLIGQTQSREVGYIDLNGDYFLTKRVGDGEYVVRNASDVSVNFISDKLKVFENWRLAMVEKNFEGNYYCFNCD
jgi:hypothetical protein